MIYYVTIASTCISEGIIDYSIMLFLFLCKWKFFFSYAITSILKNDMNYEQNGPEGLIKYKNVRLCDK